jgi:putative transposase
MPEGLRRFYGAHDLHFITCSCYHRQSFLGTPGRRDLFLEILEQVRQRYQFVITGYVVMPEHFHILMTEPEQGTPSTVMQVLKQRFNRSLRSESDVSSRTSHVWQERFYDFNVWSEKKEREKLRYMHRNPVKRGLVAQPDDWKWSSFCSYAYRQTGLVRINFQDWPLNIKRGLQVVED